MTSFAEALMQLAEPRPIGDRIKVAISRAGRAAGLPYARSFNIWYGRARRIDAHEAQQITAALQRKRDEEARHELQDLRTRLFKMESRIAAQGADQSRASLHLARQPVRGHRGMDRAVGEGERS